MSRPQPTEVWFTWCDHCGQADYAFNQKPENNAYPGCPKCETGAEYQKVAGPFVPASRVKIGQEVLDKARRVGKLSRNRGTAMHQLDNAKTALFEAAIRLFGAK